MITEARTDYEIIQELKLKILDAKECGWTQEVKRLEKQIDDILLAKGMHPFIND